MIGVLTSGGFISRASGASIAPGLSLLLLFLVTLLVTGKTALAQKPDKHIGSVTGRVLDEAGQPMANVVINTYPAGGTYDDIREAATDDSGTFVVDHLLARPYSIYARAEGYVEAEPSGPYHLIGENVILK